MRIFKSSKGSSTVEASLVFVFVITVLIVMLGLGIKMMENTKLNSEKNRLLSFQITDPVMPPETVLRMKWLGIQLIEILDE